uniref:Rap-GAP domain-containing protein n=1 Tax=Steinernema glaseri TaxID=37863 RepID=A0A1I7Y6R0_9BILA
MFARKPKTSDVTTSLQRFSDVHRDTTSRAKHFKLALESLCVQEKRQLVDDYSFETFHLVDSLLLQADLSNADSPTALDAENALWTLEQVLCLAPELVGKGWQRNAIELALKKALCPLNMLAVRKFAIRLFIMWYQSLAAFNNVTPELDTVFQSLLPYFPLRNGRSSEDIIQRYCNGAMPANGGGPSPVRVLPLIPNSTAGMQPNAKERAQILQVYLDKFFDYCTRETMRIEWHDETRRFECARFLLDRVINLYIAEIFEDLEGNGIDVFGGWEGGVDVVAVLDTADPVVIARYWVIRWMTNIASAQLNDATPGFKLFRKAMFASQKVTLAGLTFLNQSFQATNTFLTLMREAMLLPLPCSNVINKVLTLIRYWLLQTEFPPFVESGAVTLESSSLLLIHLATSFFHSPYLKAAGDRLQSAVQLTNYILQIARDLANPTHVLSRPLPPTVWSELVRRVAAAVSACCTRSDAYSRATAGGFTLTLLGLCVFVCAIREVELEDKMWEEVMAVFRAGSWTQMTEQWSRVVDSVTRALILNLFAIDVSPHAAFVSQKEEQTGSTARIRDRSDTNTASCGGPGDTMSVEELSESSENAQLAEEGDIHSVVQSTGQSAVWLRVWMRIVNLVDPTNPAHTQILIQTISRCIETLISISCANVLVQWITLRLLHLESAQQPPAIPALCSVLRASDPEDLVQAHILANLAKALQSDSATFVLEKVPEMDLDHLAVISPMALSSLERLIKNSDCSARSVQVAALLAPDYPAAEKLLFDLLQNCLSDESNLPSLALCVNALSLMAIDRGDSQLASKIFQVLLKHHHRLIPLLCSDLVEQFPRLGQRAALASLMDNAIEALENPREINEIEWQLSSLALDGKSAVKLSKLLAQLRKTDSKFLEGLLMTSAGQFPLPGFTISLWNSLEPVEIQTSVSVQSSEKMLNQNIFVRSGSSVLMANKDFVDTVTTRTVVGRHCWQVKDEHDEQHESRNVNEWLAKVAQRRAPLTSSNSSSGILGVMADPFQDLASFAPPQKQSVDSTPMLAFLQKCSRRPFSGHVPPIPARSKSDAAMTSAAAASAAAFDVSPENYTEDRSLAWRQFASNFQLIQSASNVPSNYIRDLRHLDGTLAREAHKVAVIYVAPGQEDKVSILGNNEGSDAFNQFVDGLGWKVTTGPGHTGYSGGLSAAGHQMPYYASGNCEVVFHVSTRLGGDMTHKLRHIGNDEVHIVWSEHHRSYRRDTIATSFCDVLIVLQKISPTLVRVHIEKQKPMEFGPLFDGAHVHIRQLPHLVRDTVINASRVNRLERRPDTDRPNRYREKVFAETTRQLSAMSPSATISHLYVPSLKS